MRASSRPFLLGLTGGIATGKTEAAKRLEALGATIIDADRISRQLTAPGEPALETIRERFGDGVFFPDGALNRRALGERVFEDGDERRALEAILHPAVQSRMLSEINLAAKAGAEVCVLVVPLLFESGIDALCDEVWATSVDQNIQQSRLITRDKLSAEQALKRIQSQMPQAERERRCDLVIRTDRPLQETAKEITRQYAALLRRISCSGAGEGTKAHDGNHRARPGRYAEYE